MLAHTSPSSLKSSSSHHQPLSHGSPPVRTSSSHHQLASHSASASHHHHASSTPQQSIKTSPSQHRRMDKSSFSPAHSPNRAGSRSADGHRGGAVIQGNVGAEKPRRSSRAVDVVGHQRHGSAGKLQ